MRTHAAILSALLLSATVAVPASANFFSGGPTGQRNVGSAPSPTPDDLRAIGDSDLGVGKQYFFNKLDGHWHEIIRQDAADVPPRPAEDVAFVTPLGARDKNVAELRAMDGKMVIGAKGERLGRILTIDESAKTVILQTTRVAAVTVPSNLLTNGKNRVMARTLSKQDLMAMARTQAI